MRFEEILPAVRAGRRARRAIWDGSTAAWRGCWLEWVPAHPLPDGRLAAGMLLVGYGGGQPLRQFGGMSWDLAEADDWDVLPPAPPGEGG